MKKSKNKYRGGLSAASPLRALFLPLYRKWTFAVLTAEFFAAVAAVAIPVVQKELLEAVTGTDKPATLRWLVVTLILSGIALGCKSAGYLFRYYLQIEARIALKSAVFSRLIGMPESFLKSQGSGYFFSRLQHDSGQVIAFYSGSGLLLFSYLLKLILAAGVLTRFDWRCVCFLLPFVLLQYAVYSRYRARQYRLGHHIQECTAQEQHRMQEYLSGASTLKTHDAEAHAAADIDRGFARWRNLAVQSFFHESKFRAFLRLPMYLCIAGIGAFGLYQVLEKHWSFGVLWALLLLIYQVFTPTLSLANAFFKMQTVQSAWNRLRMLFRNASDDGEDAGENVSSLAGDIVLSGVSFRYHARQPLLENLSFTVKDKSILFLTGENGSGKSTVLLLLLRLYPVLSGTISVGGRSIGDFSVKSCRMRTGYLNQFPDFFPGTIRDNLLMGNPRPDEEIMTVLKMLRCENLILRQENGLDSAVEARGNNFSGGERLRLALAREFLRDTDILLLDEPTASLDAESRRDFYGLLAQFQGKKTVIAVVHDLPPEFDGFPQIRLTKKPHKPA